MATLEMSYYVALFQLQHLVCDDICVQVMKLFLEERKCNGAGGPTALSHQRINSEASFQRRAEQLLSEENCFRLYFVRNI